MAQGESLRRARLARGITQSELARRAEISRQALSALEAGSYQPSVGVALKLAEELGETVEGLFAPDRSERVEAVLEGGTGSAAPAEGAPVVVGRVAGRLVALPRAGAALGLPYATGLLERHLGQRATVATFRPAHEIETTLLVAGCDPAVSLLADWLVRLPAPISVAGLGRSSRQALELLARGRLHVAGVHLRDPQTGEYNLQAVGRVFKRRPVLVINFARWELGLAGVRANPRAALSLGDLLKPGVGIINREKGSGARAALDEGLRELGADPAQIAGYERECAGHLEVAQAIAAGQADAGITVRVAAALYGLDFTPLREERYDLVIPVELSQAAPVRALLDALTSSRFAREVSAFCGYDTRQMGTVLRGA